MADLTNKSEETGKDDLLLKLAEMEESLKGIEQAKRQQSLITRIGLLLILLAILLFIWNIWNFSKGLFTEEKISDFSGKISSDIQDLVANNAEFQVLKDDLIKKVLPDITKQVIDRFKQDLPIFKQKGEKLLDNLQVYIEESVKQKLSDFLTEAVVQLEKELLDKYPKIPPEKMQMIVKNAQDVFIEEITKSLENGLQGIFNDLDEMEKTLNKFAELEESKQLGNKDIDMIKLDILESLLELAIYQLNPEKGDMPAAVVSVQGGAK